MGTSVAQYKKELLREIEDLSFGKVKEILDYVHFIKAKDVIDPSQSYFWTKNWQAMEKEADRDKKAHSSWPVLVTSSSADSIISAASLCLTGRYVKPA